MYHLLCTLNMETVGSVYICFAFCSHDGRAGNGCVFNVYNIRRCNMDSNLDRCGL